MSRLKVKRIGRPYWVLGCQPALGPYARKADAKEAYQGLLRFNHECPTSVSARRYVMKVFRNALNELMVELGFELAAKWNESRLMSRVKKIPELLDDDVEVSNPDLLAEIAAAIENNEEIEIVDDVEKKGKPAKDTAAETEEGADEAAEEPKSKKKAKKAPKASANGAKAKKAPAEKKGPSNKERVYKAWAKSKDKTSAKAEDYRKLVDEAVELSTIRNWISSWGKGKNLPACAKEEVSV